MRELQNGVTILLASIFLVAVTLSSCNGTDTFEPVGPHPTDYLDSPIDTCSYIERYEFDTPGIEAHEIETKKECITEAVS